MRRTQLACAMMLLAACGRSGLPQDPSIVAPRPQVGPIVPGMTDMWNAYVRYSGGPLLAIDASACDASPTYRTCTHAGELRRLDLSDVTSCAGVRAQDSLGALTWTCVETAAGVSLVSSGLAPGVGLRTLIDFTTAAFRPMHLTVSTPAGQRVTDDAVWWSNPVVTAPADDSASGAVLNADDTIYLVTESRTTAGLSLSGHGAALLTAPGVRLTALAGPKQCSSLIGGTNTRQPAQCVIWANASERLWLEVELWGDPTTGAVLLGVQDVVLLRLHDAHLHLQYGGFQLLNVRGARITNFTSDLNGALMFDGLRDSFARDLRAVGSEVYLFDSHDNVFENVTASGSYAGLNLQGADTNNTFVRALSFAQTGFGAQLVAAGNGSNVFVGYTFVDTANAPAGVFSGQRQTFALGIMANGGQQGVDMTDKSQTFTNLVSGMNAYNGVEVDGGSGYVRFNGQLRVGQNGLKSCDIHAGVLQPGTTETTCVAADTSVLSYVQADLGTLNASFYGPLTRDDAVNQSDNGGSTSLPANISAFDFSGGENRYRGWISGTMLGASDRTCPAAAAGCFNKTGAPMQLVDWRLVASDTLLRNTSMSVAGNAAFVDGAACPAGLDGTTVATDTHDGEVSGDGVGNDDGLCEDGEICAGNTYVIAAIELIDDYIGDDDGLCESREACVYAPNFGAYQGDGDYRLHQCVFADGLVSGVTMYAYPRNGVTPP